MSSRKVLDSYAVIAYFENEPGADQVGEFIKQARDKDSPLLMSAVNWGEVYYITARTAGKDAAENVIRIIDTLPIEIIPADREMAKLAAEFKSANKMSFADCFAAAVARQQKAELITGDKEFRALEGSININWI